jgi:hypothetical protein
MRMRYAGLLLCALVLSGCEHTMYLSDADAHGGTVNLVTTWQEDAAFDKAKEHCAQYHLDARRMMSVPGTSTLRFTCEDPAARHLVPRDGI